MVYNSPGKILSVRGTKGGLPRDCHYNFRASLRIYCRLTKWKVSISVDISVMICPVDMLW